MSLEPVTWWSLAALGAAVVDLGAGEISDAGVAGGVVAFQGVELLEVEAAGGALTVLGSGEADRLEVHPGRSSGRLAAAGGSERRGSATGTWGQSADGRRWRGSGRGGRLRQPGGG